MVELIATLPVIMMLVFGSVELCNTIYLKQFVTEVSYQGALEASRPDADANDVLNSMREMLKSRNVNGAEIAIEGTGGQNFNSLESGDLFCVTVDIDKADKQSGPSFRAFIDLSAGCVSVRQ